MLAKQDNLNSTFSRAAHPESAKAISTAFYEEKIKMDFKNKERHSMGQNGCFRYSCPSPPPQNKSINIVLTLNIVSGRLNIPKRSEELTVAAVGGNLNYKQS